MFISEQIITDKIELNWKCRSEWLEYNDLFLFHCCFDALDLTIIDKQIFIIVNKQMLIYIRYTFTHAYAKIAYTLLREFYAIT